MPSAKLAGVVDGDEFLTDEGEIDIQSNHRSSGAGAWPEPGIMINRMKIDNRNPQMCMDIIFCIHC